MADGFKIEIAFPDGDAKGLQIIERGDWRGRGIIFSRESWPQVKTSRGDLRRGGVYILEGYPDDDDTRDEQDDRDLPMLYIGQADSIRDRLQNHVVNKIFWDRAIVVVSNAEDGGLNRAHAVWLECELIRQARIVNQCRLENATDPQEPRLSEGDKADMRSFLRKLLQILPLIRITAFEQPRIVATPRTKILGGKDVAAESQELDTIIVPAHQEGFERVFLNENRWRPVQIAEKMRNKIRFVAGYITWPIKQITHVAPIDHIESYGDKGKFQLVFSQPAIRIGPIPVGENAPDRFMSRHRYTSYEKLLKAKTVTELFEAAPPP